MQCIQLLIESRMKGPVKLLKLMAIYLSINQVIHQVSDIDLFVNKWVLRFNRYLSTLIYISIFKTIL